MPEALSRKRVVDLERVWFLRWCDRLPGPNAAWLVVIGLVGAVGVALSQTGESGLEHQRGSLERWGPYLGLYAMTVYGAAVPLLLGGARRAFERLRPHMRGSPEELDTWVWRLSHYEGVGYRVTFWLTVAFAIGVQELNSSRWSRIATGDWQAFDLLAAVAALAGLLVCVPALFMLVHIARVLRRATWRVWHPPLFDEQCGRPLVRFGLHAVLLLTAGNIAGAVLLAQSFSDSVLPVWAGTLYVSVVNAIEAILVLLFPVLVWRTKIRREKAAELERVQRAIDGDGDAVRESPMAQQIEKFELLELLDYRRQVKQISELPFGAGNAGRLLLYLLLPPASWAAAAMTERLIERMFD